MNGKVTVFICVLLVVGNFLPGFVQTTGTESGSRVTQVYNGGSSAGLVQLQIATSPPPQPEAVETSEPIASEAGRDYGLIVGAVILMLIVVGGVIFGIRQKSVPKARD